MSHTPPPSIQSVTLLWWFHLLNISHISSWSPTPLPAARFEAMLCLPLGTSGAPNLILLLPGLFLFYSISRLQPEWASKKSVFIMSLSRCKTFYGSSWGPGFLSCIARPGDMWSVPISPTFCHSRPCALGFFHASHPYTGLGLLLSLVSCWNNWSFLLHSTGFWKSLWTPQYLLQV